VLSRFYGEADLAVAYTHVTLGTVAAQALGAPLAAALLSLDGVLGMAGWQWLFVCEGVPTLALAGVLAARLPDGPADASFLTPDERVAVAARARAGADARPGSDAASKPLAGLAAAARDGRTWHCALVAALEAAVKNAIIYWSPLIIAGLVTGGGGGGEPAGATLTVAESAGRRALLSAAAPPPVVGAGAPIIALLSAAPFGVAAASMWATAARARATGEKTRLIAYPFALGALCLLTLALTVDASPAAAFGALLATAACVWAPAGVLSSLPAGFLAGPAAAAGVALINSLGNVGGAAGPVLVGALKARTGGHAAGLAALALAAAAAAAVAAAFPVPPAGGRRSEGGDGGGGGDAECARGGDLGRRRAKVAGSM